MAFLVFFLQCLDVERRPGYGGFMILLSGGHSLLLPHRVYNGSLWGPWLSSVKAMVRTRESYIMSVFSPPSKMLNN